MPLRAAAGSSRKGSRTTIALRLASPSTCPCPTQVSLLDCRALTNSGRSAKHVQCPIYFAICGKDTVAPPGPSIGYAKQAPHGTVKVYKDMGHFEP